MNCVSILIMQMYYSDVLLEKKKKTCWEFLCDCCCKPVNFLNAKILRSCINVTKCFYYKHMYYIIS